MDIPLDIARWQSTRPFRSGDDVPSPSELERLSRQLAAQTKDIQRHPYDPESWLQRSETLGQLRYPELAFGDAHKAGLICEQLLRDAQDDATGQWRLGSGMGFWMLEIRPDDEGLRARLLKLQQRARKAEEKHLCSPKADGMGKFCPRPYPWLMHGRACRSNELVATFNAELTANARDLLCEDTSFCEVRRHAFGDGVPESRDVLGVFATRDIYKGSTILVDKSHIWGCNGPGKAGDLENLHGGSGCGDPIHPNLPHEDTSLDLRWIRDEAGKDASLSLLDCRLLLTTIQDGVEHPLDHHLIARLTPTYRYDGQVERFYRLSDFEIPLRALQQFGIDVFANHNFDTWVLFTIAARVENNCCGCVISESLMPLFSLFNHSCEPNLDWIRPRNSTPISIITDGDGDEGDQYRDGLWSDQQSFEEGLDHATIVVTAKRDVEKGEQLFVEYDSFIHGDKVEERRERLKKWLPEGCMCARCEIEAAEEQNGAESKTRGCEAKGDRDWDDAVRVQLPEDRAFAAGP